MRRGLSLALVATGLMCFSSGAFAYAATAYLPSGTLLGQTSTPGDVTYSYQAAQGTGAGSVTFTASPIASVSTSINSYNPVGQHSLSGGGVMTYRFFLEAQANTVVPIDFSGLFASATTPAPAGYGAFTQFTIQSLGQSPGVYSTFQSYFQGDCGAPICLQFTTFNNTTYSYTQADPSQVEGSFEGTLDLLTGADGKAIGEVLLSATAGTNRFFTPASATASIDPYLEIDSAFLALNPGAKLTIEAGVGNEIPGGSTAVPEPTTLALVSLALFGATAVRRKRVG